MDDVFRLLYTSRVQLWTNYLIASCVTLKDKNYESDSAEKVEGDYDCSKPFEIGQLYFKSGHVTTLQDAQVKEHSCVKVRVYHIKIIVTW